MDIFVLKNNTLKLEYNCQNGALVRLVALKTGWEILNRPQLGLSFRLLVPLSEEKRDNPVYGEKQSLSELVVDPSERSAVLTWNQVNSEYGGELPIRLVLTIKLDDNQVIFHLAINNDSRYVVENVYCPYLGDIQHPDDEAWFKIFLYWYATAQEWPLWPYYRNMRGYFGVDYPTQFATYQNESTGAPVSPYILLRGEKQGLYVGVHADESEYVAWHTELRPGYDSSINSRVPKSMTIAGKDVHTRFAAVHIPYIQPGERRNLIPITLEAYQGGWQQGVDIYKRWRNTWMKPAQPPAWAREPHSWQQIHINSPEDELRMPFSDLVKIGEDCARHEVKAIQLVGWNDGGQDQGNPSHTPDPRLGTFDELKAAIAKIQALGVKVILFSKFTWADQATQRFRKNLVQLAVKDPYGDYYQNKGYQYQTATQLVDINTKRLIPMCFLSDEYLEVCNQEFQKILDLGADGILFDECYDHTPALLCFDSKHGHRLGACVYSNDRRLIRNFEKLSRDKNPNFLYAGESCYDWEMEVYHLSYQRSEDKEYIPLSRYMLPGSLIMTAVTGFDDRDMLNQCLLYRYIISYEPYNFKGRLDDYPDTMAYGKQVDNLRTELREYFWDGEFHHEVGAIVTRDGKIHHPYAVFISPAGKKGLAIANYDEKQVITVHVKLDDGSLLPRYRLVDDPEWKPTRDGIIIPPRSAAVVIE